ncbi:MAG: sulfatase-like hydrolase/transferase [Kordiimonadaceae bacterium]|nr:sulfatase-like hydrolase/transferase [Kordiimonadaceae bacterium]
MSNEIPKENILLSIAQKLKVVLSYRYMKGALWGIGGVLVGLPVALLIFLLLAPEPTRYGLKAEQFAGNREDTSTSLEHTPNANAPNIVFILADDLGYGDVEAFGETPIRTPNLNRLAAEGVRFTDFYAPAPVCSPSRVGYLTGRYPLRTGMSFPIQPGHNPSLQTWAVSRARAWMSALGAADMKSGDNLTNGLPLHEITIAEGLKQAGYATGVVGKWHLGDFNWWPEYHPFNHGFDFFVGFNASNDDWPVAFYRGTEKEIDDIGLNQQQYTQLFTTEAVGFIEQNQEKPFFLFLSHKDPHQPFFPSDKFIDRSEAGRYGDAVEELDASVGTILDTLDRLSLSDNTVVIFASDNGPWYEGDAGGLRGRKGTSNEGGYRVPFLLRYPEHLEAGSTHAGPAMGIDLLPSLFSMAGVSLPKDRIIDGRSLFDSNNRLIEKGEARELYFAAGLDFEAVRRGDLKYIQRNSGYVWPLPLDKPIGLVDAMAPRYVPVDGEPVDQLNSWPKLYNLDIDAAEAYDISDAHPDDVSDLDGVLQNWRKKFVANPTGFQRSK